MNCVRTLCRLPFARAYKGAVGLGTLAWAASGSVSQAFGHPLTQAELGATLACGAVLGVLTARPWRMEE